ncbi:MarC family protein [Desulfoluna sp.]|uniref:MarC family protein n=1 Tax=Desulfoluna sp. TaxID=2045199 RepID=UPI00263019CA|nr:MarC family protein [Desulfoluna sp.]
MDLSLFINDALKIFFIFTPFFVLSAFISMTQEMEEKEKKCLAVRVTFGIIVISFCVFLFGKYLFALFGITLDAFRIGAGSILFLSGVSMVGGSSNIKSAGEGNDIAIVPLALPITVGPGGIGVLLLFGAEATTLTAKLEVGAAILTASACVGTMLFFAPLVVKAVGKQGVVILSKITGLMISAISAQIIFTGIRNFLLL